ncbi:MAG: Ig-like domain-containing protein, partial [Specibacter sp.]
MKTEIGRKLRSEATKRAASHPVNVERALMAGSRRYWWKALAAYASATAVIILLTGAVLLGHLANVGLFTEVTFTAITVTPAMVSMLDGDSRALTAELTYSDGSTGTATAVAWTSSNSLVAAVDG